MRYILAKLTMFNFKLFEKKVIEFNGKELSVFDGPNGYGKTSSFDAIEYALTGDIERISTCVEVDGKQGYEDNCIIHSNNGITADEAWVEAVFCPTDEKYGLSCFSIRRIIHNLKGKENNPQNIRKNTYTVIAQENQKPMKFENVDEANKCLSDFLGDSAWRHFNQYYYISQEDRLSFLNKKENNRMSEMGVLFNTKDAEEESKKCTVVKNALKNIVDSLKQRYQELEQTEKSLEDTGDLFENPISYKQLLLKTKKNCVWDMEKLQISDRKQLEALKYEVYGIMAFSQNFSWFQQSVKNNILSEIIKDERVVLQRLMLLNYNGGLKEFLSEYEKYTEIKNIYHKGGLDSGIPQYEIVDFDKLALYMNISFDKQTVEGCKDKISKCRKQMSQLEESRSNLRILRQEIIKKRQEMIESGAYELAESVCPLCGHLWNEKGKLEHAINEIGITLEVGNSREQELLDSELDKLALIYRTIFKVVLEEYLFKYAYMEMGICKEIFEECKALKGSLDLFDKRLEEYKISMYEYTLPLDNIDIWNEQVKRFVKEQIISRIIEIPESFLELDRKYDFTNIFTEHWNSERDAEACISAITIEDFQEKISYLEQQFYINQLSKKTNLEYQLTEINKRLDCVSEIHTRVGRLEAIYKSNINTYRKQIVSQIRIPFYLYSGRILQNYTGGLGVVLDVIHGNSIRLRAFDRPEHDVTYTFSSGQLSAVIIALTMTLNKIYANDNFRCILIDDPVQTMDDLNVASLVELLRTDFTDYQFIISTHEPDFSDYIRYKFKKCKRTGQSIEMNNLI